LVPLYTIAYFYTFIYFLSFFLSFFLCFFYSLLVAFSHFELFNVVFAFSVSLSLFLFYHSFPSSQLSVPIFFLLYLLPSFHLLFVDFLVSLVISTENISSQIPVPRCFLRFSQTFSCRIFISLVPDFMVFDQEFVEVHLHNLLRRHSNFS